MINPIRSNNHITLNRLNPSIILSSSFNTNTNTNSNNNLFINNRLPPSDTRHLLSTKTNIRQFSKSVDRHHPPHTHTVHEGRGFRESIARPTENSCKFLFAIFVPVIWRQLLYFILFVQLNLTRSIQFN